MSVSNALKTIGDTVSKVINASEDIIGYISDLSMKDELNTLSTELTFKYLKSPWDRYVRDLAIEPGMQVTLCNHDQILFIGRVVSVSTDGSVTCYEAGYYLNKSEIVYQASGAKASDVIKDVLKKTGVPVGWIAPMEMSISKSWVGTNPSEIIKDVIDTVEQATSKKYQYFCRCGRFYVRDMPYTKIWPTYKPASNISEFPIMWAVEAATGTDSIDGMANATAIVGQGGDSVYTGAIAKNSQSIAKYGLLEKVVTQSSDPGDAALKSIAEQQLKDLDQLNSSRSAKMWGSDMVMAGEVMEFNSDKWNLVGDYRIKSVTHNYERAGHTMELELENASPVRSTSGADSTTVYGLPDDLGQSQSSDTESVDSGTSSGIEAVEKFISAASEKVGWSESKAHNSNAMYPLGFGKSGAQWCGYFVDYCARTAGISTTVIPDTGSSQEFMAVGKRRNKWHSYKGGYTPKRGDIVVWTRGRGGTGHVGIMISADRCICGNASNAVKNQKLYTSDGGLWLNGFYSWWEE